MVGGCDIWWTSLRPWLILLQPREFEWWNPDNPDVSSGPDTGWPAASCIIHYSYPKMGLLQQAGDSWGKGSSGRQWGVAKVSPVQLTSIFRTSQAWKGFFFSFCKTLCRVVGGMEDKKGHYYFCNLTKKAWQDWARPWKISSNGNLLWIPQNYYLERRKKKKKASHWSTEMTMIYTRSSCPSGAFMPCKDQRRQGLSCHSADIDGVQVEKASGCWTECEDG